MLKENNEIDANSIIRNGSTFIRQQVILRWEWQRHSWTFPPKYPGGLARLPSVRRPLVPFQLPFQTHSPALFPIKHTFTFLINLTFHGGSWASKRLCSNCFLSLFATKFPRTELLASVVLLLGMQRVCGFFGRHINCVWVKDANVI